MRRSPYRHVAMLAVGLLALSGCVDRRQVTPEQAELARNLRQDVLSSTSLPVQVFVNPDAQIDVELEGTFTSAQLDAVHAALMQNRRLPVGTHVRLLVYGSHIDEPHADTNGVATTRRRALNISMDADIEVKPAQPLKQP